jgi:hypothetical protein
MAVRQFAADPRKAVPEQISGKNLFYYKVLAEMNRTALLGDSIDLLEPANVA